MTRPEDKPPADRQKPPAASGGTRTKSGTTYGDYVPDSGQPQRNDDRDAGPAMGDYYTGGGKLDDLASQPRSKPAADQAAGTQPSEDDEKKSVHPVDPKGTDVERNQSFDTPHTHASTTSRKV